MIMVPPANLIAAALVFRLDNTPLRLYNAKGSKKGADTEAKDL